MPCPRCVRRPAESASPILPGEFLDLLLSPSEARAGAQPGADSLEEAPSQPSATSGMEAMYISSGMGELQKIY